MKKRLLSMLLLVALLVTAIPVMAISASDGESVAGAPVFEDITTLYVGAENGLDPSVKDGQLTGLFTAFAGETDVYDLDAGKWFNKVDDTFATLRDTTDDAAWTKGEKGGLTTGIDDAAQFKAAGTKGIGMDFPVELLTDDFTVEATAVYRSFAHQSPENHYLNSLYKDTFRFDMLTGLYSPTNTTSVKMLLVWRTDACTSHLCIGGRNTGLTEAAGLGGNDVTKYAPGGATIYAFRDYDEAAATYTYTTAFSNGVASTVCNDPKYGGKNVYGKEEHDAAVAGFDPDLVIVSNAVSISNNNTRFTMFNRAPADVYAVRVYDYVLTEAERDYNHFIDLLAFYQVDLPASATAEQLATLAGDFAKTTFVYNETEGLSSGVYSTIRAALKDAVTPPEKTVYDELYIEEGLTGLFTAFGSDTASYDLDAGKWHNKQSLGAATLRDTTDAAAWTKGEKGGLTTGIDDAAQFKAAGTKGIGMDFPVELLTDDFTVEATAVYRSFTHQSPENHYLNQMWKDTFRFDVLTGFYSPTNTTSVKMLLIWRTDACTGNGCASGRNTGLAEAAGIINDNNAKYAPGGATFYAFRNYDEAAETYTYTTAFSNVATSRVCDGIRPSDGKNNNCNGKNVYGKAEHDAAVAAFDPDLFLSYGGSVGDIYNNNTRFTMFNRAPADVYAVRVYDRLLTGAERDYNHLIDLLAFYEVAIPEGTTVEQLWTMATTFATTTFVYNETAGLSSGVYSDNKKALEAAVASLPTEPVEKTAYDKLYIEDGLVGLFTAFAGDASVEAGLAEGRWYNKQGISHAFLRDTNSTLDWGTTANGGVSAGIDNVEEMIAAGGSDASNANKKLIGIDFPAYLLADSFTVEATSVAHAFDLTGYTEGPLYYNAMHKDTMRVGLLTGFYSPNLNKNVKMFFIWRTDHCTTNGCNGGGRSFGFSRAAGFNGQDSATTPAAAQATYAPAGITLAMTRAFNGENYTYDVSGNQNYDSVCTAHNGGNVYTADAHAADIANFSTADTNNNTLFTLFNRMAADAYAVRVYDRVLDETEKQYNHLIDLLAFYQVAIPEGVTAEQLALLAGDFDEMVFVYNEDATKAAGATFSGNQAKLKAAFPAEKTVYDELYIEDGLVGLYTAFGSDTASYDLEKGLWSSKVLGAGEATLRNTTDFLVWGPAEKGGLTAGIDDVYKLYNAGYKGEGIDFPVALLNSDSFTVESTAVVHGFEFNDANGNALVSGVSQIYANSSTTKYKDTFRVGLMTGFFSANIDRSTRMNAIFRTDLCAHYSCNSTWNFGFADAVGLTAANKRDTTKYAAGGATFAMTRLYDGAAETYTYGLAFSTGDNTVCYKRPSADGKEHEGGMVYAKDAHDAGIAAFDASEKENNTLFTMFNRMPADIYAVRVYNRLLTAEELQYNHLIDLFAFYQVALPADASAEMLAPMASDFYKTTFVYDNDSAVGSGDYNTNKQSLEAALKRLVTLDMGDKTETHYAKDGTFTLPTTVAGKTLFGWKANGTAVAPGATVAVSAAVTYTALMVSEVTISEEKNVQVLNDTRAGDGIVALRFNALVDKAELDALNVFSGSGDFTILEMGIVITPKSYVDQTAAALGVSASKAFTMKNLKAWYGDGAFGTANLKKNESAYLQLVSEDEASGDAKFRDGYDAEDTVYTLSGGFGLFSESTLLNNPEFAAVAYFIVDYDGKEGQGENAIIYGGYDEEACVSVYECLEAALGNFEEGMAEYEAIRATLNAFAKANDESAE